MSRKMSRRGFLQGAVLAAGAAAIVACRPEPTATPKEAAPEATTVPTQPAAEPVKEVVEIVVSRGEHASQPILQNAPARVAQGDAVGVKIIMQPVPGDDFGDKLNVWMATGQVPDIVRAGFTQIRDFADPDVFKPVLPLIDAHGPNLTKFLGAHPDVVGKLHMNDDLFILPSVSYNTKLLAPSPCIRKDFLEELDLPFPTTFDELYETLKEIKKAKPDCLGYTHRGGIKRLFMVLAYPYGTGLGGWMRGMHVPYWEPEESKWVYGPIRPEFKGVLEYVAKLYEEGLMDPDIATATSDLWHERNSTDRAAFSWDNFSFCVRWNIALREVSPEAAWTPFPVIAGAKGARQNDYSGFAGSGGGWCLGAGCKHPDRAIELMDFKVTPEGLDLSSWGIQDTHYTLEGNRPGSIEDYSTENLERVMDSGQRAINPDVWEEYSKRADPFRSYQSDTGTGQLDFAVLWDDAVIYSWDEPGEMDGWYEMSTNDPGLHPEVIVPSFTPEEVDRLSKIQTDVNTAIDPAIDGVVLGTVSLADFDKAVQDAIRAGAEELADIYNEAEARA